MKHRQQQQRADYQVIPYAKYRRWMAEALRSTQHKTMIHGLLEADVTTARTLLREHRARTRESLSFTAFLIMCLAQAVGEHRAVQALRQGSKRLVLFDDVDVLTNVEREVSGQTYVIPHVIRAANRKTVRELHREIRTAQRGDSNESLKGFWPLSLPTALFRPFLWAFGWIGSRRPRLWKKIAGTVEITAVGMFGSGAGWGIPPATPAALILTVGGIGEKQVTVEGHTSVREYLSLTVSFDHDIVDGAPAARFTARLKELIESGYGLDEVAGESGPSGAEGVSNTRVEAERAQRAWHSDEPRASKEGYR